MKTLVIGTGGREHALAWALSRDPGVSEVHAAPGNPGIAARRHPARRSTRWTALRSRRWPSGSASTWWWSGPEAPLVAGVADAVRGAGIACFGPSREAARLEGSKAFAKEVMAAAGVPTARARVCTTPEEAAAALDALRARRTSSRTTAWPPARASW